MPRSLESGSFNDGLGQQVERAPVVPEGDVAAATDPDSNPGRAETNGVHPRPYRHAAVFVLKNWLTIGSVSATNQRKILSH